MSNQDQPNGKMMQIEMEIALDQMREVLPSTLEMSKMQMQIIRVKYLELVKEGFTEAQALEIVKTRPLFEK